MNLEKIEPEDDQEKSVENSRLERIKLLENPQTPLDERLEIANNLFPFERKQEMIAQADHDKHGRPVSYFRLMSYKELGSLLLHAKINPSDHPQAQKVFENRAEEIKNSLLGCFDNLPSEIKKELGPDFDMLMKQFTFESAASFLQNKLPLGELLSFHFAKGEIFPGIDGLISCSAGIPVLPPSDSSQEENGTILVEMVIPSADVIVGPIINPIREMSKEVNTKTLKPEWIVDIYQGKDDFFTRFVLNPEYSMLSYYEDHLNEIGRSKEFAGTDDVFNALQKWKQNEPLENLIPLAKITDMDMKNPTLNKPLYTSK